MTGELLLRQLEYLVVLARERHFGLAAAACHVSQPTLSAAISRLERHLGVQLVHRGHRFEGLTDEGVRVLAWAHRILAERDELLADVERSRGGLTATARIGAIPTSVAATPLVTGPLLAAHPSASVQVESLASREIARRLADFTIDAGVTYLDDETPPGTRRIELYRERYLLLAPADHPVMATATVGWADAATLPMCVLSASMRNRRILATRMASAGASLRPVVEADSVGALYVHLGLGGLATVVAHAWLHAYGIPDGMAVRPMAGAGADPAVGLIVLDREPGSIVADALAEAARSADIARTLDRSLAATLGETP